MGFCPLLKTWVKVWAINMVKNLLIALRNLQLTQWKLLQKEQIEAFGDLIDNKIADKITSVSKKKSKKELDNNDDETEDVEIATPKKRYISPEEVKQIIEELRLVPKKDIYF